MFERLGSWTYRFRFLVVMAWIALAGFMAAVAPSLAGSGSADQTTFLPASAPSVKARDAVEHAFPGSTSSSSASITMHRAGGLTAADRSFRDAFAAWTSSDAAPAELRAAVSGTETADSRPELKGLLRSDDGSFEMLVVNLDVADTGDSAAAVVAQLRDRLVATTPSGLETHVTGAAAISSDYLKAVEAATQSTTMITILLVVIVLLVIYRAPLAALVPLATIGSAYVVARGLLGFLAAAGWQVASSLETFLVVMVFGVGTDYAIFLISRYREEVAGGGDWHAAARVTVRRIGAVITASAGTVIVGMMAMGVGDFRMIATMGPSLAIGVAVTLVAGLTLAPALLSVFGHYLFWPLHTKAAPAGEPTGFFASLANVVSKRPGLVTAALLAILIVPMLYIPQVTSNFDVLRDLPATADSRLGYEAISTSLGEDKLVQSTGFVAGGGDVDLLAPAQLAKLRDLMVQLQAEGGIGTTTSLVTPNGDTTVPDGFRPSKTLTTMADGFDGDTAGSGDASTLLDRKVTDGLAAALDYVSGLAVAFPDVAAGSPMRDAQAGLADARSIVTTARDQTVLSSQLRTLAASVTDPANAAGAGASGADRSLMRDYLAELATAYPEVRDLDAYRDAAKAAKTLEKDASIAAALALSDAFDRLADHFDGRPDATLSPASLAGTPAAKEQRRKAEATFGALPDRLTALSAVFAARADDLYVPTNLSGSDGDDVRRAVDAFMTPDHAATRFYIASSNDPYSGGALGVMRQARTMIADGARAFGPAASGHLVGATIQFADVQDTLSRDFLRVGAITVLGILLVLVVLLRAVVAPLYLVATVLVSYGSTIGISGFLFQEVLGHPGVSPYLPLIVFVLLVALGSDYNIFLMHRVREESEHRPIRDGVRIASGHTGAVITSAGLILAGTFGSMATASLVMMFQVGIAVAIGVLIDTFLVRSILVPAITTLVGDRAWWPSGVAFAGVLQRLPGTPEPVAGAVMPTRAGRRSRIAVAVGLGLVVLIPVTAAGLLTWSFGSASDDLGSARAAVVNLDAGGSVPAVDGSPQLLALGSDLTRALTGGAGDGFTWVATDAASAAAGLEDGRYAAVLTIPAAFSRSVATIRTDPTGSAPKAALEVATADGADSTLGTVARAVAAAIGTSTAHDITASYVDDVLVRVADARRALSGGATEAGAIADDGSTLADDATAAGTVATSVSSGLRELADGASSATSGTGTLVDGMRQLADGTDRLASGAVKLAQGTTTAASGARELSGGASSLSSGLQRLRSSVDGLPAQTSKLAGGAAGVADGATGVADGAAQVADGLAAMAKQTDGMGAAAKQLDSGAASLEQGARDLRDGADQTAAGAGTLATGAADLSDGVDQYTGGVDALASNCAALGGGAAVCGQLTALAAGSSDLRSGAAGVQSGAAGVRAGVDQLAGGMDGIVSGADGVHDGTTKLAGSLPALESGISKASDGATGLATGAGKLSTGAGQLAAGTRQLAGGMPALHDGIVQLAAGASVLADGMGSYADGARRLAGGTAVLASGAKQTAAGAGRLADGAGTAMSGIGRLTDALSSAADGAALVEDRVGRLAEDGSSLADRADGLATRLGTSAGGLPTSDAATRDRIGSLAADPVTIDATATNAAGGAANDYAPFFMALAAWLGVLGAFLVVPATRARPDRRWWLTVLWPFAGAAAVAVIGSLLMVLFLDLVLGVTVANVTATLGFAVLAALAFTAVVQALIVLFGTRGWLAALLLLVLGIAASGLGTDVSVIPWPLAMVRPLLPTTAAIDAFHAALSGPGGSPALDAFALVGFLVIGVLVSLAVVAPRLRRIEHPIAL